MCYDVFIIFTFNVYCELIPLLSLSHEHRKKSVASFVFGDRYTNSSRTVQCHAHALRWSYVVYTYMEEAFTAQRQLGHKSVAYEKTTKEFNTFSLCTEPISVTGFFY